MVAWNYLHFGGLGQSKNALRTHVDKDLLFTQDSDAINVLRYWCQFYRSCTTSSKKVIYLCYLNTPLKHPQTQKPIQAGGEVFNTFLPPEFRRRDWRIVLFPGIRTDIHEGYIFTWQMLFHDVECCWAWWFPWKETREELLRPFVHGCMGMVRMQMSCTSERKRHE